MLNDRVYNLFSKSVEAKMQVGEALAPELVNASQLLVETLLNEKKIIICGNAASSAIAQIFSSSMVDRFEQERPGLPVICLGQDNATYTSIATENGFNETYAKPIRVLGNTRDVLIIVSTSGNSTNLINAVSAAHEREMKVIALTGRDGGGVASLLDTGDIELCAKVDSRSRIHEIHLLCIFCLCDLIDSQLFGLD